MTSTFCTSGAAIIKAGSKVNSFFNLSGGAVENLINQAESLINVSCRENFITNYATLSSDVKKILEEVASDLTAVYIIQYDMSGANIIYAEDKISVLRDAALRGISILRDKKAQDFINNAT